MGTAEIQGTLWGASARDYADLVEGMFCPVFEQVLAAAGVGRGTRLLDIGCGPGLAARLAAQRGAEVAGLDAAEPSIAIARARTPQGDFRVGEMEELPWPGHTFDVVTSFNAFQFAADLVHALQEASRVTRPGGQVALVVWGQAEACESMATIAAISKLLPPPAPPRPDAPSLATPEQTEAVLARAGLTPLTGGEVDCWFNFADLETAARGMMSAGIAAAAAQHVGVEAVRQAIITSLPPFATPMGGYRQRNRFRYLVASV
jgi:SAM-dependent methyltransferase